MTVENRLSASKRRTRAEVQQLVAEFVSSGMRRTEFCQSRGFSFSTLDRHLKKLRWKRRRKPTPSARDNWNISLFKNFPFNEDRGTNLQFRAEFFNIWNHPQWVGDALNGGISTNYGAGNFGAVTSAHDPRTIQLALKFSF